METVNNFRCKSCGAWNKTIIKIDFSEEIFKKCGVNECNNLASETIRIGWTYYNVCKEHKKEVKNNG